MIINFNKDEVKDIVLAYAQTINPSLNTVDISDYGDNLATALTVKKVEEIAAEDKPIDLSEIPF